MREESKLLGGDGKEDPVAEGAGMTPETPEHRALAARLDALIDRLDRLEVQVRGLVTSQTVEPKEFVVRMIAANRGPASSWPAIRPRLLSMTAWGRSVSGSDSARMVRRPCGSKDARSRL